MINKRAFFCSLHCQSTDQVFVFGGNDGTNDLAEVEMYDFKYNNWVQLQDMCVARNGASCVLFERYGMIFIFGGVSEEKGVLDTIEKYNITLKKWEILKLKLIAPLHDFVAHSIGKERVLIIGSYQQQKQVQSLQNNEEFRSAREEPQSEIQYQILDLSVYMRNEISKPKKLEKVFLPSFLDAQGFLYLFHGYPDSPPKFWYSNIQPLIVLNHGTAGITLPPKDPSGDSKL